MYVNELHGMESITQFPGRKAVHPVLGGIRCFFVREKSAPHSNPTLLSAFHLRSSNSPLNLPHNTPILRKLANF